MSTDNTMSSGLPVIMLGSGGHAKVLSDALRAIGVSISGMVDPYFTESNEFWQKIPVIGSDDDLLKIKSSGITLVNGVGCIPPNTTRKRLYALYKSKGFQFFSVVHPSAILGSGLKLGEGVQLMSGVIVQADTRIGNNSIINTRSSIDHDCMIGSDVHIAPGVVISGGVSIGNDVHIGPGAIIVQGISIGQGAIVGAGTVVTKDVPEYHKLLGQSPRPLIKMESD